MSILRKSALIFLLGLIMLCFGLLCNFNMTSSASSSDYAYIKQTIQSRKDGKIFYELEVYIDFSKIIVENKSLDESEQKEFKDEIDEFKRNLTSIVSECEFQMKSDFEVKYNAQDNEKFNPNGANLSFKEPYQIKNNYFGYKIEFSDINVFNFYFNNVKKEEDEGTFISYSKFISTSPFSNTLNGKKINEYIIDKIKLAVKDRKFSQSFENFKPNLYIDLSTFNGRVKSSAGLVGVDDEGYYHHIWDVNDNNFENNFALEVKIIHGGWWFLLCLSISLGGMIFAIIITILVKKYKNIRKNSVF